MQWALLCVTKLKLQGSALWRGPKLKIPSPCHKAETRQRDQGLNSDKEGQRGRGAEGQRGRGAVVGGEAVPGSFLCAAECASRESLAPQSRLPRHSSDTFARRQLKRCLTVYRSQLLSIFSRTLSIDIRGGDALMTTERVAQPRVCASV
jgi:hypothetical protein